MTNTNGQHHSSSSQGAPSMGESMTNNTFTNTTNTKIPMETICWKTISKCFEEAETFDKQKKTVKFIYDNVNC